MKRLSEGGGDLLSKFEQVLAALAAEVVHISAVNKRKEGEPFVEATLESGKDGTASVVRGTNLLSRSIRLNTNDMISNTLLLEGDLAAVATRSIHSILNKAIKQAAENIEVHKFYGPSVGKESRQLILEALETQLEHLLPFLENTLEVLQGETTRSAFKKIIERCNALEAESDRRGFGTKIGPKVEFGEGGIESVLLRIRTNDPALRAELNKISGIESTPIRESWENSRGKTQYGGTYYELMLTPALEQAVADITQQLAVQPVGKLLP